MLSPRRAVEAPKLAAAAAAQLRLRAIAALAVPTGVGLRVPREELIAAAMRTWPQAVIEEALGEDAARILPDALRLVELRARIPRYQHEMLHYLARMNGATVDEILTRELEDVACAYADELSAAVPGFHTALAWPLTRSDSGERYNSLHHEPSRHR